LVLGPDLRHELQRLIAALKGVPTMMRFTTDWLVPWSIGARGPCPGPLCLLYVLPAMHVAPVRWGWRWAVPVLCVACVPWDWWKLIKLANRVNTGWEPWALSGVDVVTSLVLIGVLAGLTRSWRVAAWSSAVTLVASLANLGLEYAFEHTKAAVWADLFPVLAG